MRKPTLLTAYGEGEAPRFTNPDDRNLNGNCYTLEAAIPWSALDVEPKDGLTFRFDLAVDNSIEGKDRACQLAWNGKARNSSDRSAWGRLTMVP